MKKNKISILICLMLSSSVFLSAAIEHVTISDDRTYVKFNGFDFEEYKPEDGFCLDILAAEYDEIKNDPIANKDFVLVGHSQGGLRALAFAKYAKDRDPTLYDHIKGVITLSGIDQGLSLLEDNGWQFRCRFFDDVGILNRGVLGCVAILSGGNPFTGLFSTYDLGTSAIGYGIATAVLEIVPATKNICTPVLSDNWDEYEQIKDMCPQSDFIKKYVIDKDSYKVKRQIGTKKAKRVRWATKKVGWFKIKYAYLEIYSYPVYANFKITKNNVKLDKDMNMAFLVGANNDTMSMLNDDFMDGGDDLRGKIDKGMETVSDVFEVGQGLHITRCVLLGGLVSGSVKYAYDCGKAAKWTRDYKGELNDLKGSDANDGLVACLDQSLPTKTEIGTSNEKTILNNTIKKEYSSLNHATIDENDGVKTTYKALIADWTK